MMGIIPNTSPACARPCMQPAQQHCAAGIAICLISHMSKQRHREAKALAQGRTAVSGPSQDLKQPGTRNLCTKPRRYGPTHSVL